MGSDYAVCTGDTGTAPTTGIFQLVNSDHMKAGLSLNSVPDGLSNTLMVGEKHYSPELMGDYRYDGVIYSGGESQTYQRRAGASQPLAIALDATPTTQFGSWHTGVCQFVFGDGSVQAVKNSIPGPTLAILANRADGLPTPALD